MTLILLPWLARDWNLHTRSVSAPCLASLLLLMCPCVWVRGIGSPFTIKEVPSVELRLSGLHTRALTTLSHLTGCQLLTFTSLLSHTPHTHKIQICKHECVCVHINQKINNKTGLHLTWFIVKRMLARNFRVFFFRSRVLYTPEWL